MDAVLAAADVRDREVDDYPLKAGGKLHENNYRTIRF